MACSGSPGAPQPSIAGINSVRMTSPTAWLKERGNTGHSPVTAQAMGECSVGCVWLRYGKLHQGFHLRSSPCGLFLEVLCHKSFRPESSSKVAASFGDDIDTSVSEDFLGSIMVIGFDNQPRFGGVDVVPEVRSTGSQDIPPRFQGSELASLCGIVIKPHLFGGWCSKGIVATAYIAIASGSPCVVPSSDLMV